MPTEISQASVKVKLPGWRQRRVEIPVPSQPLPAKRLPRITRLMALAIKFQDMVDRGEVRDYADIARLGYVSRARVTQIMNLLLIAPDLQEQILYLEPKHPIALSEKRVRSVASAELWATQRAMFARFNCR